MNARSRWSRPLPIAAAFVLAAAVPVAAQVAAPVLKWQRGGCFASWCQTGWYSSPAVADLDADGRLEVIGGSYDVVALDGTTGSLKWRAASGSRVWPGVVVADLVGDGTLEVIVGRGSDLLTVYDRNGTALWTRNPFGSGEVRTLAVADLEHDGQLDIVVGRASGGATKQLSVYDAGGSVRPGWPARRDGEAGSGWGMYNQNVVVADLGDDGYKELVGPTDTHYITALDRTGAQLPASSVYGAGKVWSQVGVHVDHAVDLRGYANCGTEHRPNFADSAPIIADLDGDGTREIVVVGNVYNCGTDPYVSLYQMPFVLRADRSRWSGSGFDWTVLPPPGPGSGPLAEDYSVIETVVPNPVVADLDGDGRLEILYPSYDGKLHAYWLDKTEHGSWPYDVPGSGIRFASEPVVADLDGDGRAEVIFTSWPQKSVGGTGQIHVLDYMGNLLHAVDLPAPFGGAAWNGALGAPTLDDIDLDGDLDVVVGTVSSGLVAYSLPSTSRARILWGTGRGGYLRSGVAAPRPVRRDIGGDGRTEVLWRNTATGALFAWQMDGRFAERASFLGTVGSNWSLQAATDFTGDGRSDVLWREAAGGTTYLWAMNGAAVTAASGFTAALADPSWEIAGAGDLDGDRRSDLLWRKSGTGPGGGNGGGLAHGRQGGRFRRRRRMGRPDVGGAGGRRLQRRRAGGHPLAGDDDRLHVPLVHERDGDRLGGVHSGVRGPHLDHPGRGEPRRGRDRRRRLAPLERRALRVADGRGEPRPRLGAPPADRPHLADPGPGRPRRGRAGRHPLARDGVGGDLPVAHERSGRHRAGVHVGPGGQRLDRAGPLT